MSKKSKSKITAKRKSNAVTSSPAEPRQVSAGGAADWRWGALSTAHPTHPALAAQTVYALPPRLIDALQKPPRKFFSEQEERFERDLARLSGGGFFLNRPISHPLFPQPELNEAEAAGERELLERQQRSAKQIDLMLADEKQAAGWSDEQSQDYSRQERAFLARIEERQWGYIGWLVTDAGFRQAREALRERWGDQIAQRGSFPQIPKSWFGEQPLAIEESDRELHIEFLAFYRSWGLNQLVTWELPTPVRAEMSQPSLYFSPDVGEAGFMVFVPWYMFRDKDLKLRELAEHKRDFHAPAHLAEWLSGEPKKFGFDRFAKMLELYLFLELALRRRYGDRFRGRTEEMQLAFGDFFYGQGRENWSGATGADNVKKIRQAMNRRLK